MRFSQCKCGRQNYERLRRPLWMRLLFSGRAYYRCLRCDHDMLIPAEAVSSSGLTKWLWIILLAILVPSFFLLMGEPTPTHQERVPLRFR